MAQKRRRTPLAKSDDGSLYVELRAIMTPICALIDGLPLVLFGRGKTAYLAVDVAIEWMEKEKLHHNTAAYELKIEVLKRFKEQEGKPECPTQPSPSTPGTTGASSGTSCTG
jgi:arginine deiminase